MEELDRQLKGVLLRIAVSETLLEGPVLGEDATFEVKVHALQSAVSELEGTTQFHVCMYLHMHCIYACVLHIHTGMVYTPFCAHTHTHVYVCIHAASHGKSPIFKCIPWCHTFQQRIANEGRITNIFSPSRISGYISDK